MFAVSVCCPALVPIKGAVVRAVNCNIVVPSRIAPCAAIAQSAKIGAIFRSARQEDAFFCRLVIDVRLVHTRDPVDRSIHASRDSCAIFLCVAAFAAIARGARIGAFYKSVLAPMGWCGSPPRHAVTPIVTQATLSPTVPIIPGAIVLAVDLYNTLLVIEAFGIILGLDAACAAIGLGARLGCAIFRSARPEHFSLLRLGCAILRSAAATTLDCHDCVVREDSPDNLENSHTT